MPKRKRRRRQEAIIGSDGGYRWLSAPVVLAFGLGGIAGWILGFVPGVGLIFFYISVFLVTLSVSHMVGRRLRRRAARQQRTPEAPSRPQAPQRTRSEG